MEDFVFTAMGLKFAYAIAGVLAALYFSRWLDRRAGLQFREVIAGVAKAPLAAALYYGLRFVAICLLLGLLVSCAPAQAGTIFPDRYDPQIRQAVDRYWPTGPDWVWWKAQLFQESRLRPEAVSPVGAAGLAQFMPATWREVSREIRLPPGISPHSEIAIEAGAYFMAKLARGWTADRPLLERHRLAQASYNAGTGNILRAQALCHGARLWDDIAPCLAAVTGAANARETIGYVSSIARWRAAMLAGLR